MRIIPRYQSDPQQRPPAAYCSLCGGELYDGEHCWRINGHTICRPCLGDFARDFFAVHREVCGEEVAE